jgi:hypothetical protein
VVSLARWSALGWSLFSLTACSLPSNLREPLVPGEDAAPAMEVAVTDVVAASDGPAPDATMFDQAAPEAGSPDGSSLPDAGPEAAVADVLSDAPAPDVTPSCVGTPARLLRLGPPQGAVLAASAATLRVSVVNADFVEFTHAATPSLLATATVVRVPVVGGVASLPVTFSSLDRNRPRVWRATAFCGRTSIPPTQGSFRVGTRTTTVAGGVWPDNAFERIELDVNGDGRTDIAASGNSSSSPGIAVAVAGVGTQVLNPSDPIQRSYDAFVPVGDVNGNGTGDLLVGYAAPSTGSFSVFDGGPGGLDAPIVRNATLNLRPGATSVHLGGSAVALGDLNSDGRSDFAVSDDDAIYVISGASIVSGATRITPMATIDVGTSVGGISTIAAADFDGDGDVDLAAGAPNALSYAGQVLVFRNDGGMFPTASATVTLPSGGTSAFGIALATGAFRNDGSVDLVVGASGERPGSPNIAGDVFVYRLPLGGALPIRVSNFTPTGGASARFGANLASSGDHDMDGFSEFVVMAPTFSNANMTLGMGILCETPTDSSLTTSVTFTPSTGEAYITHVVGSGTYPGTSSLGFVFSQSNYPIGAATRTGALFLRPYMVSGATFTLAIASTIAIPGAGVREMGTALAGN